MDIIDSMAPRNEIRVYPLELATLFDNPVDIECYVDDEGDYEIIAWRICYYNHYKWKDPVDFSTLFDHVKSHAEACQFYPQIVIDEAMDKIGELVAEDPVEEEDDPTEDYSNDPEFHQDRNG
jgi:hypothetical protein